MSRNIQLDNTIKTIRNKAANQSWGDGVMVELSESHDDNLVSSCTITEFLQHGNALRMVNGAYENGYESITISVLSNGNCLYSKEVAAIVEQPKRMELYQDNQGTYTKDIPHEVANEKLNGLINSNKIEAEKSLEIQKKVHEKALGDLNYENRLKEQKEKIEAKEKELTQWKSKAIARRKELEAAALEKASLKATIEALSPIKAIKEIIESVTKSNPALLPTILSGFMSGKMGDLFQAQAEMMSGLGAAGGTTKEVYAPEIQYILDYLIELHNGAPNSFAKFYEVISSIIELGNSRFQYHFMAHQMCENGNEAQLKTFLLGQYNQQPSNEIVTDVGNNEEEYSD